MFLSTFSVMICLYVSTASCQNYLPASTGESFDFSSLEDTSFSNDADDATFNVELASVFINGITSLNDIPEMDLESRIKQLQSFHPEVKAGLSLEDDIEQLMQIHGVTKETFEEESPGDHPSAFSAFENTLTKEDTNDENILKRVKYLENTFHKEEIAGLSNTRAVASPCLNGGVYKCECPDLYYGDTCEMKVDTCKTPPTLAGAVIKHTSADGKEVIYVCKDDFRFQDGNFQDGNPKAKCSSKTGIWELSTMICLPTQCYYKIDKLAFYGGTKNTVKTPIGEVACQRFDSQSPHEHDRIFPYFYRTDTLAEVANYCRDPDHTSAPWCYTTDPDTRYGICDVPICSTGPGCSIAPFVFGAKIASMKQNPNGEVVVEYDCLPGLVKVNNSTAVCTDDGSSFGTWKVETMFCALDTCKTPPTLAGAVIKHTLADGKEVIYDCKDDFRFQEGNPKAKCSSKTGIWELSTMICLPMDCYVIYESWTVYHGTKNHTKTGKSCQRWDSQTPHAHKFTNIGFYLGEKSFEEIGNKCREPSSNYPPWCFTVEDELFEFCDVDLCDFVHAKN